MLRGEEESDMEDTEGINTIYNMSHDLPRVAPITRKVKMNRMEITFEVNKGCGVIILCKQQDTQLWKKTATSELNPCTLK